MNPSLSLVRSPSDRSLPPVFAPEPRASHRPRTRYVLRIRDEADVSAARKRGVPLLLLTDREMDRLDYPMRFPPVLFVPHDLRPVIAESSFRVKEAIAPPAEPRDEDTVTYLLKLDPLAARAVLDRNLRKMDLDWLTIRITEEHLNSPATRVRMQDRLPKLVTVGDSWPRDQLARALARNRPHR
ncbi:MAG: hypothetical protein ACREDK_03315 [Thermoplasmata archaeon]